MLRNVAMMCLEQVDLHEAASCAHDCPGQELQSQSDEIGPLEPSLQSEWCRCAR